MRINKYNEVPLKGKINAGPSFWQKYFSYIFTTIHWENQSGLIQSFSEGKGVFESIKYRWSRKKREEPQWAYTHCKKYSETEHKEPNEQVSQNVKPFLSPLSFHHHILKLKTVVYPISFILYYNRHSTLHFVFILCPKQQIYCVTVCQLVYSVSSQQPALEVLALKVWVFSDHCVISPVQ